MAFTPVPRTRPLAAVWAVRTPAEVIVPVPVVEILLDVEMVFAMAIDPKPEAMEPEVRTPVVVIDPWPT